jgi:hypothetical protein
LVDGRAGWVRKRVLRARREWVVVGGGSSGRKTGGRKRKVGVEFRKRVAIDARHVSHIVSCHHHPSHPAPSRKTRTRES